MALSSGIIQKHVGETIIIGFRYHSPALDDDESIIAASASAQTGITMGTVDISGAEVYGPVSGGTAGTDYTIRFTVSTDQGQVFIDDYLVKVIA